MNNIVSTAVTWQHQSEIFIHSQKIINAAYNLYLLLMYILPPSNCYCNNYLPSSVERSHILTYPTN